jgi:hypothetical protein
MGYFEHWGHMYLIHFGVWLTFMFGTTVYKSGIPSTKDLPILFKSAIILSLVLSAFSSHSHTHYLMGLIK